jgi:DnaJ-class molecular chaperone
MEKIEEKLIICEDCEGNGYVKYIPESIKCPTCGGLGRLLRQITINDSMINEEILKRKAKHG